MRSENIRQRIDMEGQWQFALDQPSWYYRFVFGRPSVNQLKKSTLQFCGVKPVKVTYVEIVKTATEAVRMRWLTKINKMGKAQR